MRVFERSPSRGARRIDRFEAGVGWLAHPRERGRRASHAIRGRDGVWVIDPVDAPGVDGLVADLGDVAGVAVCSNYHARDAGRVARRHGVAVWIPEWMDRVAERVDAPVRRYGTQPGDSGFRVAGPGRLPPIREAVLVRPEDGTLYVPESLGTAPAYTVGDERVGTPLFRRLLPPRDLLSGVDPDRILFGHGEGVFVDAGAALTDALVNARRRLPAALVAHAGTQLRSLLEAGLG